MYNGPCHLHAPPLVAFTSVAGLALLFTHFGGSQVCHPILTPRRLPTGVFSAFYRQRSVVSARTNPNPWSIDTVFGSML